MATHQILPHCSSSHWPCLESTDLGELPGSMSSFARVSLPIRLGCIQSTFAAIQWTHAVADATSCTRTSVSSARTLLAFGIKTQPWSSHGFPKALRFHWALRKWVLFEMLLSPGHMKFGDSSSCCQPNLETGGDKKALCDTFPRRPWSDAKLLMMLAAGLMKSSLDALACLHQKWPWDYRKMKKNMIYRYTEKTRRKTRNNGNQTYSKSMFRFKLHSQMMADRIHSHFLHNAYAARGSLGGLGVGIQKIGMPTSKSIINVCI